MPSHVAGGPADESPPAASGSAEQPAAAPARADAPPRLSEVGWIVAGRLDDTDWTATLRARGAARKLLAGMFPEFTWSMPLVRRDRLVQEARAEPVDLFEYGVTERDSRRWDFVLLVTGAELVSHYKPFAMAAVSRSLDLAVISTLRLDPDAVETSADRERRVGVVTERLVALVVHVLGHQNGLSHDRESDNYLFDIETVDDLDAMRELSDEQRSQMLINLGEIADLRLEERRQEERVFGWRFYLQGAWINRHEIFDAVRQAKPWEFPARLSRLTTAALSASLVLLMTAETWDVALHRPTPFIIGLSIVAVVATTAYVVLRQQLFLRRERRPPSEQIVITNLTTISVVFIGMVTTYLMGFVATLLTGLILFDRNLVRDWVRAADGGIGLGHYLVFAAFVASLAILIGALGASFERQQYFRHITYVDEET